MNFFTIIDFSDLIPYFPRVFRCNLCYNFIVIDVIQKGDFLYQRGTYNDRFTCPMNVNGTVILLGGLDERKQISVVYPFGVKRINTLPFDFQDGRCLHSGLAYLCFSYLEGRQCRSRYAKAQPVIIVCLVRN